MITPEEFAAKMREIAKNTDIEQSHDEADCLMCQILTDLGYVEGVVVFRTMDKWYA